MRPNSLDYPSPLGYHCSWSRDIMKRLMIIAAYLLGALSCLNADEGMNMANIDSAYVRPPAVAGAFYPDSPSELAKMIADFYHKALKPHISSKPVAIIAPHAGYIYSGQIAAGAYKILEGEEYNTVIVISPSHTIYFKGVAAFDGKAYSTPLGQVPINRKLTERLANECEMVELSGKGHLLDIDRSEHALEVQLPFLQLVLGKFDLVPLVMGDQDMRTCARLGEALADIIGKDDKILIVASSDLSHFHNSTTALKLDSIARKEIETLNYRGLAESLASHKTEACGGGPIITAMIAATALGADSARITGFGDSGDATGDKGSVVGYLSAVLYRSGAANIDAPEKIYNLEDESDSLVMETKSAGETMIKTDMRKEPNAASGYEFGLTESDKITLLSLARRSIESYLGNREPMLPAIDSGSALNRPLGAFVTLHKKGELRGCIGTFHPGGPLYQVVAQMAGQAAFSDYRFAPVQNEELKKIDIEISVLTPMRRISDPREIVVGRDGVYIKKGAYSGVLLPQVPIEQGWGRDEFLDHACLKAGLTASSWKDKDTEIFVFQAEIFGER